jgi:hypothetical protein
VTRSSQSAGGHSQLEQSLTPPSRRRRGRDGPLLTGHCATCSGALLGVAWYPTSPHTFRPRAEGYGLRGCVLAMRSAGCLTRCSASRAFGRASVWRLNGGPRGFLCTHSRPCRGNTRLPHGYRLPASPVSVRAECTGRWSSSIGAAWSPRIIQSSSGLSAEALAGNRPPTIFTPV